jgi:hypothetical protein
MLADPDEIALGYKRSRELAKAAIEAMREPTTDVLDATMDWHNHVAADENYPMARGVMRAAVDAALEGK